MISRAPTGIYHKPLKTQPINWAGKLINVVSLGCAAASLTDSAGRAIAAADLMIGSKRHFSLLSEIAPEITRPEIAPENKHKHEHTNKHEHGVAKINFPKPFSALAQLLESHTRDNIVILASGDALFYGVGTWLTRVIGREHCRFHPGISSIQASFHAVGLPWQSAEIVSLHGRAMASLRRHLKNNALLGIFTNDINHPSAIARELSEHGFGSSIMWVCEAMGSTRQCVSEISAACLTDKPTQFHPLNIVLVQVSGGGALPSFPGIADHLFHTGAEPGFGMISKREVRLSILSLMQPSLGEIAWDIGAGCGSVSVEWARWNEQGEIYAIENNAERVAYIEKNSAQFGTTLNLTTVHGSAPRCCEPLPDPDCIFIGGSGNLELMLDFAWGKLKKGGKLVVSAVTLKSRADLENFVATRANYVESQVKTPTEWVELSVHKNLAYSAEKRKLKSVLIVKCVKDF